MAFANNINRDMTSADARAVAGKKSWDDIYPENFDFDSDPEGYIGDHRLYFDTHGVPHFVSGKNPFSGELARYLADGEKDGLLSRKASGSLECAIKDTRNRYGEPKEWDHLVVGLSRAEVESLGAEGVKDWARTVVKAMQQSPSGDGNRQMLVTPLHTDTDNIHLQFLLHRIPVNETAKTVGASFELSRNSEAASQMKQLNTALEAAGLPMISDFRMGAYSVSEPRAISAEELSRGAERVREAGGITPPDLTTGPLPVQRERVSPEMRHLDSMLADAVKRQKEAEAIATSAATAVAAAQHAKAALEQYEVEMKQRMEAEALAAVRLEKIDLQSGEIEKISADLDKTRSDLVETRGEVESLSVQLSSATATIAEQIDAIESLESIKVELGRDLDETRQQLARTDQELEQTQALRLSEKEAFENQIFDLTAKNASIEQDLAEEKRTFNERAKVWAEEHVAPALNAQIDMLRSELLTAREDFTKRIEAQQQAFMKQQETMMQQMQAMMSAVSNNAQPVPQEQVSQEKERSKFPKWTRVDSMSEWSAQDRKLAEGSLNSAIKGGRVPSGTTLEAFYKIANERFKAAEEKRLGDENSKNLPEGPKK